MKKRGIFVLNDVMTSAEMPFHSKITDYNDDNWYHSHDFYEFFYIIDGQIDHEINGVFQTLQVGDMGFINKTDIHSFLRAPGNTCRHRDIIIRSDFFESICAFIGPDFTRAYMNNELPKVVSLPLSKIEQYEQRIIHLITPIPDETDGYKLEKIKALLVSMLNCLLENTEANTTPGWPAWFRELLNRFTVNEYLRAGLDEILSPFHFTKTYVGRVFKKYMNCTMTEYLNDVRLQHAAFQLTYTDENIINICTSIGFSSISYFNKIFRQKYGVSPKAFRKASKAPL